MPQSVEYNLIEHVQYLAGKIGQRSWRDHKALDLCAEYIEKYFRQAGCVNVRREPFEYEGTTYYNVMAEVRGEVSPGADDIYVVGAHYDTVEGSPGADDNASGIAGLLEMARLAARNPWRRTVRFYAFCLEEPPVFRSSRMGSMVSARTLREAGVRVRGMVALEMIGYFDRHRGTQFYPVPAMELVYPKHGDFIAFVGNVHSRRFTKAVKKSFIAGSTLKVVSLNISSMVPGVDFSDHRSFWKNGYQAFMVTDTAFYRNPNYHSTGDMPDTLDYTRTAQVVMGLHRAFLTMP